MSEYSFFLVDDDMDDQFIFFEALATLGVRFKKQTARDGVFALELVHSEQFESPNIIFLDLNMPRMNGQELLKLLRANARLNNVPIVVYSTSLTQNDVQKVLAMGANACMCKHSEFEDLCGELRNVLEQHLPGLDNI